MKRVHWLAILAGLVLAIGLVCTAQAADPLPVLEPSYVTYVSRLLYYMCSGLLTDGRNEYVLNPYLYSAYIPKFTKRFSTPKTNSTTI